MSPDCTTPTTEVATRRGERGLVNVPNWLPLTFRVDNGAWFDIRTPTSSITVALMRRAIPPDTYGGRTGPVADKPLQRRLVSMTDPHLAGLESTTAENWPGTLQVDRA
jgi:trehalose/maltose hydrolase-like predicted phosphorylase